MTPNADFPSDHRIRWFCELLRHTRPCVRLRLCYGVLATIFVINAPASTRTHRGSIPTKGQGHRYTRPRHTPTGHLLTHTQRQEPEHVSVQRA